MKSFEEKAAYHNGFGGVHSQAADRHQVALEGLSQVEGLHVHRWEAQLCHWVGPRSRLHRHHLHLGSCQAISTSMPGVYGVVHAATYHLQQAARSAATAVHALSTSDCRQPLFALYDVTHSTQ